MRTPFRMAILAVVFLSWSPLSAQWLLFSEETSSRLLLTSVAMNDGEEKDISVGDFDKDGWMDVVVVRKEPFSVVGARTDVLLMNENGVLIDRTAALAPGFIRTPTDSRDVLVADLNGDSWLDLVIANTFSQQPSYYANLGNDLKGNWQGFADESTSRFPAIFPMNQAAGPQFCAVWSGDLDGDTDPDLYFSNYTQFGATSDALLINDGNGNFTDETVARLGENANVAFGTSVEFHDVDGDNDLDIIKMSTLNGVAPFIPRGIFILYNNGSGLFDVFNFTRLPLASSNPYMFTGAFLDGDNLLDFYVVNDDEDEILSITAVQPNGPATMSSMEIPSPRTDRFGGNVKLADMDGDGYLDVGLAPIDVDIANCGLATARFALLRNDGNANFDDPWANNDDRNIHTDPHDFAFLDVDRDGQLDIFMGTCDGWAVFIQRLGLGCPGDCSPNLGGGEFGDGVIDMADLMDAIVGWGGDLGPCDMMPNVGGGEVGDGRIDVTDLIAIRNAFGICGE